ncbi:hypothetical protein BH24CHL1_BH24CHL1_00300 [soil metagenome]
MALIPELGTEKAGFKNTERRQPITGDGAEFALVSVPSLRWYNPDQVRRVSGHVIHNLSALSAHPWHPSESKFNISNRTLSRNIHRTGAEFVAMGISTRDAHHGENGANRCS